MDRDDWVAEFAREAGVPSPSAEEVDTILALAATAAHASHRTAAPIACWLGGRAGMSLDQLNEIADRIAGE